MASTAATHYSTFSDRYADLTQDPFHGDYRGVMTHFRAPVTGTERNEVPVEINTSIWNSLEAQPHVYLALANESSLAGAKPRVFILHRPSILSPPLGSGRDPEYYAFAGDVVRNQPPVTIYWPEEPFKKTAHLDVASSTILDAGFADDPAADQLGPYDSAQPGLEMVCTRPLMYLPPKYASAALTQAPMTPRRAWEVIGGAIRTDPNAEQLVVDLKPLLDWLKAACTLSPLPDTPQALSMGGPPVPVYPHPQGYHAHIESILNREVPAWKGAPTVPTGVEQVAVAVNTLTDRLRENQEDMLRRSQETAEKTPTKYWADATLIANRITWTRTPNDLPELFQLIARSNKTNLRGMIQEHLRVVAQDLNMEGCAPLVTPSLAKKLASLQFGHTDLDNLDEGIQPFVVGVRSHKDRAALAQYISYYDDIVGGGTSAQLGDLRALSEKDKAIIPRTLLQASTTLRNFQVLLSALLPEGHGFLVQYQKFCHAFQQKLGDLEERLIQDMPALIIRYIQIRVSTWFTEQEATSGRVDPPNFMELLQRIQYMDSSWIPGLPTGATGKAPPPVKETKTKERTEHPTTAARATAQGRGDKISNADWEVAFKGYKENSISLKTVREVATVNNLPIPSGDQGEMCLSYHVLGFCWSNCARKATHTKLMAADKNKLLTWCQKVYV